MKTIMMPSRSLKRDWYFLQSTWRWRSSAVNGILDESIHNHEQWKRRCEEVRSVSHYEQKVLIIEIDKECDLYDWIAKEFA